MTDTRCGGEGYLLLAAAGKAHGLNGYIRLITFMDNPDGLNSLSGLHVWREGKRSFLEIEDVRLQPGSALVKFAGVNDRTGALGLRGLSLYAKKEDMPALEEGSYYIADLIGCAVRSENNEYGKLTAVYQHGAADVYQVEQNGEKTMLFPALKRVLLNVDIASKAIIVDDTALKEVAVYED